ncbi:hypothetical protein F5Y05DRAFT_198938 [Hypoxylon sp. FL0543]|nr:hypothetical protein F5Y05DRAFT_198938 [Hypoxylon sp. FL0543]
MSDVPLQSNYFPTHSVLISATQALQKAKEDQNDINLTVTSPGRSSEPIKIFLDMCRDYFKKQEKSTVTIRALKRYYSRGWNIKAQKTARHTDSVHIDDAIKANLVSDIERHGSITIRATSPIVESFCSTVLQKLGRQRCH